MALSAQQVADLTAFIDAYAAATNQLSAQAAAQIVAAYSGVNFYNAAAVAAAAEQAADTSNTAATLAAGLTAEYLAYITGTALGGSVGIPNLPLGPIRNGFPLDQVYVRPIKFFRRKVAEGVDPALAFQQAMTLAASLADSDVRLAERGAADRILRYLGDAVGVTGYRRAIHPELSRTGTCGLCIAASDRIYKTGVLMPMHDNCNCAVVPIFGENDPGNSLNNLWLDDIYAAAGGKDAWSLKKVRYAVHEHSEKGPVLVNAAHGFLSADDLANYDPMTA